MRKTPTLLSIAFLFTPLLTTAQWSVDPLHPVGQGIARIDASSFKLGGWGMAGGSSMVVTNDGTPRIRRTTSSGAAWQTCYTGPSGSGTVWDIQYIGHDTVVACVADEDSSRIIRSANDGSDWTQVHIGTALDHLVLDFSFPTHNVGYGVGAYNKICKTTSGGVSWNWLPDPMPGFQHALTGVCFTSTTVGFVAGAHKLMRTTNGGSNWDTIPGLPDIQFYGVTFPTPTEGFAYGVPWGMANGVVLYTTDGGTNWATANMNVSDPYTVTDLIMLSPTFGYLGTANGHILVTSDAGQNWYEDFHSPALPGIYTMATAATTAYAFGLGNGFAINTNATAINEEDVRGDMGGLQLWPVPNQGTLVNLTVAPAHEHEPGMLRIYSVLGEPVRTAVMSGPSAALSFATPLASGMYVVEYRNERLRLAERFVVEH